MRRRRLATDGPARKANAGSGTTVVWTTMTSTFLEGTRQRNRSDVRRFAGTARIGLNARERTAARRTKGLAGGRTSRLTVPVSERPWDRRLAAAVQVWLHFPSEGATQGTVRRRAPQASAISRRLRLRRARRALPPMSPSRPSTVWTTSSPGASATSPTPPCGLVESKTSAATPWSAKRGHRISSAGQAATDRLT